MEQINFSGVPMSYICTFSMSEFNERILPAGIGNILSARKCLYTVRTDHFKCFHRPEQVEHGLEVLLDITAACGGGLASPGPGGQPFIGGQH